VSFVLAVQFVFSQIDSLFKLLYGAMPLACCHCRPGNSANRTQANTSTASNPQSERSGSPQRRESRLRVRPNALKVQFHGSAAGPTPKNNLS